MKFKKFVLITWEDICAFSDWKNLDAAKKDKVAICYSTGFIIEKNKHSTIICSDWSTDSDGTEVGNRNVIPNSVIKKVEVLYEHKNTR
tara:strand:- start:2692 stop:2955 length:264 start_codon:yes stop_codon:yes gene_type:complete